MSLEFISEYSFGRIVIESNIYVDDIILLGKKVKTKWWRKSGHSLIKEDLKNVIEYAPELLIIGTGSYGMMEVPANLSKKLNFEVIAYPTNKAVIKYNREIEGDKKIAGAFHLTC